MSKIKPETLKKKVEDDIKSQLGKERLKSELTKSKLREYMELYDHKCKLQDMAERESRPKQYMDLLRELRQVEKSMRDLLDWMLLAPVEAPPKEESYDL